MLTQEYIDTVFALLRKVHTAHWKVPSLEAVQKEISRNGHYVFRIGSGPWVADVVISAAGVEYIVNQELPERMRKHAEGLKQQFISSL